jgi:putative hydrolase of the HAD superfamily
LAQGVSTRQRPQWLFDLDNVLHDALAQIMPQISRDMNRYLVERFGLTPEDASVMRQRMWHRYGATLTGLQREFPGFESAHFLAQTHAFPLLETWVRQHNPGRQQVARVMRRLSPRPVVVTNAPREYALQMMKLLGLHPFVRRVVAIEDMVFHKRWMPKPSRQMLARVAAQLRVHPSHCIHIEDTFANLKPARTLRMRTVYVRGYLRRHARTRPMSRHLHTGVSRRIGVQVQSVLTLPRIKTRR